LVEVTGVNWRPWSVFMISGGPNVWIAPFRAPIQQSAPSLADEDIIRLIPDGTVIKTGPDRKTTNISVLAATGLRRDGQKVLLSVRIMGGGSTAAWRRFPDDPDARSLKRPNFVIVDGTPGPEAALVALRGDDLPIRRCTAHRHRNLPTHATKYIRHKLTGDYRDMICADTPAEIKKRRRAFLREWCLKCRAVADSLEGDGDRGPGRAAQAP
jgi:transposase-like protein